MFPLHHVWKRDLLSLLCFGSSRSAQLCSLHRAAFSSERSPTMAALSSSLVSCFGLIAWRQSANRTVLHSTAAMIMTALVRSSSTLAQASKCSRMLNPMRRALHTRTRSTAGLELQGALRDERALRRDLVAPWGAGRPVGGERHRTAGQHGRGSAEDGRGNHAGAQAAIGREGFAAGAGRLQTGVHVMAQARSRSTPAVFLDGHAGPLWTSSAS